MRILNISTDKLIPYKNNPRNNDAAVQYVANSIRRQQITKEAPERVLLLCAGGGSNAKK